MLCNIQHLNDMMTIGQQTLPNTVLLKQAKKWEPSNTGSMSDSNMVLKV